MYDPKKYEDMEILLQNRKEIEEDTLEEYWSIVELREFCIEYIDEIIELRKEVKRLKKERDMWKNEYDDVLAEYRINGEL